MVMTVQVLRALGLKSDIDSDAFVAIAQRIDGRWRELEADSAADSAAREEAWQAAKEAAEHLREHAEGLHGRDLYERLKPLAFFPAFQASYLTLIARRIEDFSQGIRRMCFWEPFAFIGATRRR